jgi:aminoglycoside 2'-N-acetyltransferase I
MALTRRNHFTVSFLRLSFPCQLRYSPPCTGDVMSIEIEIVNGDQSLPQVERLFSQATPEAEAEHEAPWRLVTWANPDLRVLIDAADGELACHAGSFFRTATWNGQKVHIAGLGQVATRPDCRRRGYASIAIDAAVLTMRDHDAAQFAVLFCEPQNFEFYQSRGWHPFTGAVDAEQPGGKIRFEAMAPFVLDLKRRAPTLGTLDLCGLPW